jgi:hypothetical protein
VSARSGWRTLRRRRDGGHRRRLGASWAPAERNAPRSRNPRIALDDHRLAPRGPFNRWRIVNRPELVMTGTPGGRAVSQVLENRADTGTTGASPRRWHVLRSGPAGARIPQRSAPGSGRPRGVARAEALGAGATTVITDHGTGRGPGATLRWATEGCDVSPAATPDGRETRQAAVHVHPIEGRVDRHATQPMSQRTGRVD